MRDEEAARADDDAPLLTSKRSATVFIAYIFVILGVTAAFALYYQSDPVRTENQAAYIDHSSRLSRDLDAFLRRVAGLSDQPSIHAFFADVGSRARGAQLVSALRRSAFGDQVDAILAQARDGQARGDPRWALFYINQLKPLAFAYGADARSAARNRYDATAAENVALRRTAYALFLASLAGALALAADAYLRTMRLRRRWTALNESLRQESENAARALIRAESESRAKSEFLLRMSHELRTPLNAVIGFSDLMLWTNMKAERDGGRIAEYATDINSAGRHLQSLVDDLLALGRLDAGQLQLTREPARFQMIAERAIALAGARDDPRLTVGATDLTLDVDRRATLQILLNLIANARRYADEDATIVITCARIDDARAMIVVSDDGPGMSDDLLARALAPLDALGDPFVAPKDSHQIGLSIVQRLAESQGGEATFVTAPGDGFRAEIIVARAADKDADIAETVS